MDNKNRLTLDSDVNSSQIQVQIDFKNITLSIGLTNFIRKIKFNIHHCLNLHYMHLTVLCIVFQFECISPIPIVGSSLILRHALIMVKDNQYRFLSFIIRHSWYAKGISAGRHWNRNIFICVFIFTIFEKWHSVWTSHKYRINRFYWFISLNLQPLYFLQFSRNCGVFLHEFLREMQTKE